MCVCLHAFMYALYMYVHSYVCGTYGEKICVQNSGGEMCGEKTFSRLRRIGQDNIKIKLRKIRWGEYNRFICLLIWTSGGWPLSVWLYHSCSLIYREFLARNFQPLKKDSAPRSYITRTYSTYVRMYVLRMYVLEYVCTCVYTYVYVYTYVCTQVGRQVIIWVSMFV